MSPESPVQHPRVILPPSGNEVIAATEQDLSENGQSDVLSFFSHAGSAFSGYSAQSSGISSAQFNNGEQTTKTQISSGKQQEGEGEVELYAQDLTRKVLTQHENLTQKHLARQRQPFEKPASPTNCPDPLDSSRQGGVGLAERYNTSSRFLSKDDVLMTEASLRVDDSAMSSALNASNVSSSYYSETSRSFDSGASESGISEVYSQRRRTNNKRSPKRQRAIQDEFSEVFQNAYQSFGIKKMSDNVSFSAFDLKQLATGLNERVQAASETFRKIVDQTEAFSPDPRIAVASRWTPLRTKMAAQSEEARFDEDEEEEMTVGEGIAIEVEYMSESASDDEDSASGPLSVEGIQAHDCEDLLSLA
jgi:hypothetical protein